MRVDEFFNRAKSEAAFREKSRVLVIRNRQEQTELRKLFEERPNLFGWVRVSKCVSAEAFIPPADQVFAIIKSTVADVNATGKTAYVTGLSALMAVWDCVERAAALEQLRVMIDDANIRFYVFVNSYGDEARLVFSHPRYVDGHSVLAVGEKTDEEGCPDIRLVSGEISKFIVGARRSSLSGYLNDFEIGGFGSEPINIRVDSYSCELAGVSGSVKQLFRSGDYLRLFCNYQGGLSKNAEDWLFAKMLDSGCRTAAKDFVQNYFFQGAITSVCREAPRMILGCAGEELEVLVWMLRMSLYPCSYLYKVLNDEQFDIKLFKSIYVTEAVSLIGAANERSLCAERKEGIAAILQDGMISLDAEMADFIELTRDADPYQIVPWLTNRTKLETEECVRRLRKADLRTLPPSFFEAFPLIKDYLEPYALGDARLEAYFTEYRACKVANNIGEDFCSKARDIQYPVMGVKSREDLLNDTALNDAALLVVDAMGVEYLPMIISLAKRRNIGIANAAPAMVKIPTSTKFNGIVWPDGKRLPGIPDLDNIIHNGVHTHGVSSDEENFIAMLKVFDEIVMPAVAQALARNKKVILTADHGASRLAVIAKKVGLAQTLPVRGVDDKAEDWRYMAADPNAVPPSEVASNISGNYWVVKGYDRFSKSGGKLNELHGGLTDEEVLVPFVVFEKGATFTPVPASAMPQAQFVENDDFDL